MPAIHQLELASDVPLPAMGLYSAGSPLNRLSRRRARAPWLLAAAIIAIGVLLGAIWLLLG